MVVVVMVVLLLLLLSLLVSLSFAFCLSPARRAHHIRWTLLLRNFQAVTDVGLPAVAPPFPLVVLVAVFSRLAFFVLCSAFFFSRWQLESRGERRRRREGMEVDVKAVKVLFRSTIDCRWLFVLETL